MSALQKLLKSPQLGRMLRLPAFTIASSAVVVQLLNAWEARYPAIGVGIGLLEVLYRIAVPTQSAPKVTAVPAVPAPGGDTGAKSP